MRYDVQPELAERKIREAYTQMKTAVDQQGQLPKDPKLWLYEDRETRDALLRSAVALANVMTIQARTKEAETYLSEALLIGMQHLDESRCSTPPIWTVFQMGG